MHSKSGVDSSSRFFWSADTCRHTKSHRCHALITLLTQKNNMKLLHEVSRGTLKGGDAREAVRGLAPRCPPAAPQTKFLFSVIEHLGWGKISDYMLVVYTPKTAYLNIYDRKKTFPATGPLRRPVHAPHCPPPSGGARTTRVNYLYGLEPL